MSNPLVSVVMSVYNCEEFLEESLDSILRQDFDDFEMIIYDDASTDKTRDIIKDYSEKFGEKLKTERGDVNVGCGEGRNRAIKLAKGKYIAVQDADDISLPMRLGVESELLEISGVFCVGSMVVVIDEKGEHIDTMTYPPTEHREIEKMLRGFVNPVIDPSCMFRKDIFDKLGGYSDKWKLIPDFYLWARAIEAGYKFVNIRSLLVYYRKHPNGVMELYQKEAIREHMDMCRNYIHYKRHR